MAWEVLGIAAPKDLAEADLCGHLGDSSRRRSWRRGLERECAFRFELLLGGCEAWVAVGEEVRQTGRRRGAHLTQGFDDLVSSCARFMSWVASQSQALVISLLPTRHLCYWGGQAGRGLERTERAGLQEGWREARLHLAGCKGRAAGL